MKLWECLKQQKDGASLLFSTRSLAAPSLVYTRIRTLLAAYITCGRDAFLSNHCAPHLSSLFRITATMPHCPASKARGHRLCDQCGAVENPAAAKFRLCGGCVRLIYAENFRCGLPSFQLVTQYCVCLSTRLCFQEAIVLHTL